MKKIKVLFLMHDLSYGGAERVLTNLVNHMDHNCFDITVQTMFDVGIYRDQLSEKITYKPGLRKMFKGNTIIYKLLSPQRLFKVFIKGDYDIIVSYLEGASARVIAGCPRTMNSKLVCWIHVEQETRSRSTQVFRTGKEADKCYDRFDKIVCVSETVKQDFSRLFPSVIEPVVLYNTVESDKIREKSLETVEDVIFSKDEINLISVGTVKTVKGFDRMINIIRTLRDEGYPVHLYIVGTGSDCDLLNSAASKMGISNYYSIIGFRDNPYKYVKNADIYVCSSYREGFSTSITEALIVGTPVISTNCSGAYELLGFDNEYGVVVDNTETKLLDGIRNILQENKYPKYREKSLERGKSFSTEKTVLAVEHFFKELLR